MAKTVNVHLCRVKDKPFKLKETKYTEDADQIDLVITEKGTVSGQTTLTILLTDDKGKTVIAEITGKQFEMLCGAWTGANLNWQRSN